MQRATTSKKKAMKRHVMKESSHPVRDKNLRVSQEAMRPLYKGEKHKTKAHYLFYIFSQETFKGKNLLVLSFSLFSKW